MNRFLFFLIFWVSLSPNPVTANNHQLAIDQVTVFQQQAQVQRSGQLTIPAGTSEVIIDGISSQINDKSIQVKVEGNATLLSVSYGQDYMATADLSETLSPMKDSIELFQQELTWIDHQLAIYQGEESLMQANKTLDNEKGLQIDDLIKLTAFYRKNLFEIRTD